MRIIILLTLFLYCSSSILSQSLSSLRQRYIPVSNDTILLDTLTISPASFRMYLPDGRIADTSAFHIDYAQSKLLIREEVLPGVDSVRVTYRVFSFLLSKSYQHKDRTLISKGTAASPYSYQPVSPQADLFRMEGLRKNGSISRGITFGNNQDVFVNSSLNLQLAGKLSDNVEILAAITDENIPVQPEGNTQQLQDFDKVFIQLSNNQHKLIAGDFELRRPDSYFMNFFKKGQGAYFTTRFSLSDSLTGPKRLMRTGASIAVSKGKFSRNTLTVVEGNQGPYRLQGSSGESFIIVLSGTEKVYFDGRLLTRGLDHDYVIDYNTAEITFTAQRLITKESRIVVEFEYSDKNYARSLLYFNNEYESEKLRLRFNLYSEQDSKNQPLTIELDSAKRAVMASVGDSIQYALFPTADSVEFNSNIVLYQKKDTVSDGILYEIFVYSTNADSARWQVSFSDVGANRGDYVQEISAANGRVFRWVARVNGIPQGNYAPVSVLITPKKQQLFTLGSDYKINGTNSITVETAMSVNDVNLFSSHDKANDDGYAARIIYNNRINLQEDTAKGWQLRSQLSYEHTTKDFRPVERYRNVEFERDWNLGTVSIYDDEHISSFQTSLQKEGTGNISYQLRTYNKGEAYSGLMNSAGTRLKWKKYTLAADASLLNTEGRLNDSRFIRHSADLSRKIWKLTAGVRENSEDNRFFTKGGDTLQLNSFAFRELSGYVMTSDTSLANINLSYKHRTDQLPSAGVFSVATVAEEAAMSTEFSSNPKNILRTTTTYRVLSVKDTLLSTLDNSKTLLNRIDHSLTLWKGIVTATTFYEIGTGQERKQEYYYLLVPAGQGTYAYLGDNNNNGVKDLDEFVVSAFAATADYIRVYIPTNEFISTRSNQFSEVLTISPAGNRSSFQGKQKFLHRFTNQVSVRLDKKTKDEDLISSLNPFSRDISDSSLVSINSSYRNILYFNRSATIFGFDLTWQENNNKSFLTSGFETRVLRNRIAHFRWNINRAFLLESTYENGDRINSSDFFEERNYRIFSDAIEPKLSYQPGTTFRVSVSYEHLQKRNSIGENEEASSDRFALETKYTTINAGNINMRIDLINVRYNAESGDDFLSYEILEGLKKGQNLTWALSFQRNLSNSMQLSLNYDGRKLQDAPVVHTGGVQFRAYF